MITENARNNFDTKVALGTQSRNLCGWSLIQVVLTKQ